MTRAVAAAVLALTLVFSVAGPIAAQDDTPDCARTIIGCPDAGPKPENPGDRGGYAQFMTLGAVVAGLGFIAFRVTRSARAAQDGSSG